MKNIYNYLSLILILSFSVFFSSCEKDAETFEIRYYIVGLQKPYEVTFINEDGETISQINTPVNEDELWEYKFRAESGQLLYLHIKYYDTDVFADNFKFKILINKKTFKEAFSYDREDTDTSPVSYIIKRSGIVPY